MHAPVLFKEDGIRNLILDRFEPQGIHAEWGEDTFLLDSRFRTPDYGAALYHESTYDAGRWRFTAGLRVDFEASKLHYRSYAEATYTTQTPDGTSYPHAILVDQPGTLKQSFTEILPKISVLYRMGSSRRNTLYATVSKGYKAGGFNTQMFSDVLQQQVMKQMGFGSLYDVADVVTYKPEKSWNYEVGAHLSTPSHKVQADLALFYIDCRDQQLTVFPEGQVTGRLMTNAGRTRSFGGEASLLATSGETSTCKSPTATPAPRSSNSIRAKPTTRATSSPTPRSTRSTPERPIRSARAGTGSNTSSSEWLPTVRAESTGTKRTPSRNPSTPCWKPRFASNTATGPSMSGDAT